MYVKKKSLFKLFKHEQFLFLKFKDINFNIRKWSEITKTLV